MMVMPLEVVASSECYEQLKPSDMPVFVFPDGPSNLFYQQKIIIFLFEFPEEEIKAYFNESTAVFFNIY